MKKGLFKFSVRDITEIAVMCALAIAFDSFLNIKIGATGGSISISCLPLFIIAYRHGWFKGFIASGIIFGFTTCLLDGYGLHLYVFDYLIAFGCIGIAGLFGKTIYKNISSKDLKKKSIAIALIVATIAIFCVIRVLSGSVNSIIFYDYTLWAGIVYYISFTGPSCIAILVMLIVLLPALISVNAMYPTEYLKDDAKKEEVSE